MGKNMDRRRVEDLVKWVEAQTNLRRLSSMVKPETISQKPEKPEYLKERFKHVNNLNSSTQPINCGPTIYCNLPQSTLKLPQSTLKLPQSTAIYRNLPQFTAIYPETTPIYRNLPGNYHGVVGFGLFNVLKIVVAPFTKWRTI